MKIQQKHTASYVNIKPGLTLFQGIILGIIGEEKELLESIIANFKSVVCLSCHAKTGPPIFSSPGPKIFRPPG